MGQYYRPIILDANNKPLLYAISYDFGNGAKLMEHSWLKNEFVRFIELLLMKTPQKIVWAGDYADNEDPSTLTDKELKPLSDESSDYWKMETLRKKGVNLYALCENAIKITSGEEVSDKYSHHFKTVAPVTAKYLVNHTKKQFIDKTKLPITQYDMKIHALPLLTCEGNGRGGGDYRDENDVNVGAWARDLIGVVSKKTEIPKGYTELVVSFTE
jgi:hypothetical protein